jgi:hypothetical protein
MRTLIEAEITSEKLTHMTHTEDLYLFGDTAGEFAVTALMDVSNALHGEKHNTTISRKWDGAPSCVAASDFNGEAFVATKGFFAKDRKIAYTEEDVDTYFGHAPDLARKMKKLLSYVSLINIPSGEIWQGDFLFDSETVKLETINGEKMLTFHPNTIIYAIPVTDPLARRISRADIGVAWHTKYQGRDYNSLHIGFGVSVDDLNDVPGVFQVDSKIPNLQEETLSDDEKTTIHILLQNIQSLFEEVKALGILETISHDTALQKYLLTYRNFLIKTKNVEEEDEFVDGMISWVSDAFDKEITKKKQQETRDAYEAKKQEEIQKIESLREEISRVVLLQNETRKAKEFFVKKLNSLGNFRTLVKHIDQGYLPTGEEGFAISDAEGNIQKFVSRLEFSKNNFSQEIVKGWMSDARMREKITVGDVQSFLGGMDRFSIKSAPQSQRTKGNITVLDNENNREEALMLAKDLASKQLPLENIRRSRRDLTLDDVNLIFKNASTSSGNKGIQFEEEILSKIEEGDRSYPGVGGVEKILQKEFNSSLEDIVSVIPLGAANTRRPLSLSQLKKGTLVCLPKGVTDFRDGDAIAEALADGALQLKNGQHIPLSIKHSEKVSLINAGLSAGVRNPDLRQNEVKKDIIINICEALSPEIDTQKVIQGFIDFYEKRASINYDSEQQRRGSTINKIPITLNPDVFATLLISATGFNYIMIHDEHVFYMKKSLVEKMARIREATVAYPDSTRGRFDLHFEAVGMKGIITLRDTNADGWVDKLLIEYDSKGILV